MVQQQIPIKTHQQVVHSVYSRQLQFKSKQIMFNSKLLITKSTMKRMSTRKMTISRMEMNTVMKSKMLKN
jgi:hypothetical protein